jgi:hypothetical protein
VADNVPDWPAHSVRLFTLTAREEATVTVEVAVLVQLPVVPVMVYVVVTVGLAVTTDPVVELNPPAGDHE